jgi:hypothetical protein
VTHDEIMRPRHHPEEQLHYHCIHEQLPSDSTTSPFVPSHPHVKSTSSARQRSMKRAEAGDEEGHERWGVAQA